MDCYVDLIKVTWLPTEKCRNADYKSAGAIWDVPALWDVQEILGCAGYFSALWDVQEILGCAGYFSALWDVQEIFLHFGMCRKFSCTLGCAGNFPALWNVQEIGCTIYFGVAKHFK